MEQILIMLNNINSVLYVESFPAAANTIFCDKLRTCRYCTAACSFVKISAYFWLGDWGWGVKLQLDRMVDRVKPWFMVNGFAHG